MNAAIRFIFNIKKRKTSITPFMKKAHILPVIFRIRFKMCVLLLKCINGLAPQYLTSLIRFKTFLSSLRICNDKTLLHEPKQDQQNYKNRRFEVCGPRVWNSLPRTLREIQSLGSFKTKLKTYFFEMF